MYIKYAEIQNGLPVAFCECLEGMYVELEREYPEKQFAKIESGDDLYTFSLTHYYKNNVWVERIPPPSKFHVWDLASESWLPNIDAAQEVKLQQVTAELSIRLYLPYNGFDADRVSRERISGTIARLQRGDGLPAGWIGWRDANNQQQWANDDATTVLANLTVLSRAIEDREQALLVASWQHKANIAALTDIDAILSYDVTAGWPT